MASSPARARTLLVGSLGLALTLGCAAPAANASSAASAATRAANPPAAAAPVAYGNPATIQRAADNAAAYASARGYLSGVAVVDMATRRAYTGGRGTAYFPAESTVKVMLAANLLANGKMTGSTAATARRMIVASSDAAANQLYWSAGGDGVVSWAAARYGISALGTGPTKGTGWWGSFTISPLGFAQFLAAARRDPAVGPWLVDTMAGMWAEAADGTNQVFGLYAADRTAVVKQGWGGTWPNGGITMTGSVGWVRSGRYAVALFVGHVPPTSQSACIDVTTGAAKVLLAGLA